MNRRAFLRGLGLLGAATLAGRQRVTAAHGGPLMDSSPGPLPAVDPSRTRTISGDVPGGFTVRQGDVTIIVGTVRTNANVVVQGRLVMRSGSALEFVDVNESAFVGGGMDPVASDVGLWVMGEGVLDAQGLPKLEWARAAGALAAGAGELELLQDPIGWQLGDELAIAPTGHPSEPEHYLRYDSARIKLILGRTIRLDTPLQHDHPAVDVGRGLVMTAEVLNLTRDVRIEGRPEARTHVFIRSTAQQHLSHLGIRHVGPRRDGEPVLGRYGLHFHHCLDSSRGSTVDGVLVREGGSHAFVPHLSNGIAFRGCVAHDTTDSAFWWDLGDGTHDILWARCVASASLVGTDKYTNEQFTLGEGNGNACVGCVAVGGRGIVDSAGFEWPSHGETGVWTFEDCVAHNNQANGIFAWQVDDPVHRIDRFVGYHNGGFGVRHGSYNNRFQYRDGIFAANADGAMSMRANSKEPDELGSVMSFEGMLFDAAGAPYAVQCHKHVLPPKGSAVFEGCEFRGASVAGIGYTADKGNSSDITVRDCAFEGNPFWFVDTEHPDSVVRVPGDESFDLRPAHVPGGKYVAKYNAKRFER